jgi:Flp pilus assembly protein TadG
MNTPRQQGTEDRKITQDVPSPGCKLTKVFRSGRKKRRGTAVVEFAIVAPLFFLLVFGMIEYGRMVMVQQIITNASREGARQAVLDGTTSSEVKTTVDTFLTNVSVAGATVTITPDPLSDADFGDPVTVRVSIDFDQVSWLPSPMFLGETNLSATTVMRRESVQ